jgi:uncharacterized damage-inducible protein DinB
MTIAETLVPQFDHEMATTRTLLARVPEKAAAWKPHPKSMALGDLAQHIANLLRFVEPGFAASDFDVTSATQAAAVNSDKFQSTATLVERFDRNAASARRVIAGASDDTLRSEWTLRAGPRKIFTVTRVAMVRAFIISHIIHHRGQLSVYLRMNDVPLPPIYGPTADEQV